MLAECVNTIPILQLVPSTGSICLDVGLGNWVQYIKATAS